MSQVGYILLAVGILVFLLIVFVVSFVLYRRTPVPKGCEDMVMSEEKCSSCGHAECSFYKGKDEK